MAKCMSRGGVFSSLKSIQYSNRHPMKLIYGLWHIGVLTIVDWKIHPSSWTHCSCRSMNKCFSVPQLFRKVCVCVRAGLMPHLFLGAVLFSFYMLHLSLHLYICLCADVCPMHAALFLSHRPHVWTSHTVNSSCMITLTHRPLNDHIILWWPWFLLLVAKVS